MSSLWNRSGMVERYADDLKASGAMAYFFIGGTTTPLTVFRDAAESSAHPNPVVADSQGRWPDVFVPYIESFDVLVQDGDAVQLTFSQRIPNPAPVTTDVTVPPEQRVQTGSLIAKFMNGTLAGYVRANGRTIGNASSSATERANADAEDLFVDLWSNNTDAVCPVSGGRGVSGAADFAANKRLTTPDMRNATLAGLDSMGNTAKGGFVGLTFTTGGIDQSGSLLGINALALDITNMPAHTHAGSTSSDGAHTHSTTLSGTTAGENEFHTHNVGGIATGSVDAVGDHTHVVRGTQAGGAPSGGGAMQTAAPDVNTDPAGAHSHTATLTVAGSTSNQLSGHTHNLSGTFASTSAGTHSHTFTTDSKGSGAAFNNMPVTRLVTWFLKL